MPVNCASDIATCRYLVIDDDAPTVQRIMTVLSELGATTVDSVNNINTALGRITKTTEHPDIIICALSIPNGVAFFRHLEEKQFVGGIVLISNKSERILRMGSNLAQAQHLNVLGSLLKPFTEGALLNVLAHFKGPKAIFSPLPQSILTPEALLAAIEQDQLVPFFQPKVSVKTGKLVGVEVLARWQHPEHGLVSPGLFIPVAEEHGLVGLLTQNILSKTFRLIAAHPKAGRTVPVAVNLSALMLSDIDLPMRIKDELDMIGIDPSNLTLEITESGLCENMISSLETLLRLNFKGIRLSIDDFGIGYSTFEQLHTMPFSELKIDRIFVTGAAQDGEEYMFFQSVVMLAKKLGLTTVAEGVETQEDWDVCRQLGCDVAQGYLIGRPVLAETFLNTPQSAPHWQVGKNRLRQPRIGDRSRILEHP